MLSEISINISMSKIRRFPALSAKKLPRGQPSHEPLMYVYDDFIIFAKPSELPRLVNSHWLLDGKFKHCNEPLPMVLILSYKLI